MQGKSKRILIFTTAYRPFIGGSELAIENIVRRLPNIFFDIVTPRHYRALKKFERSANVSIWRLGLGWRFDKYFFPALGFLKTRRLMKTRSYLAVHAYQASHGAGAAWLLKLFSPDVLFILTLQEGKQLEKQSPMIKFFRRLILKKADVITGISSYLVDYARLTNRKAKALVIPNGVDLEKPKAQSRKSKVKIEPSFRERLGFKEDNRVIITVSRLVPKNGIADLITAVALVKPHLPGVKLMIIGQGPLQESLVSRTQKLDLTKEVLFLNGVAPGDVYDYLKAADVFVRPSYSEGLGSAFLEAMASGVPIIGTPVGGIPDFLTDGETGLFCQAGNPESIAQKVIEILADNGLRARVIENARTLVAQRYDWDGIARRFENLYLNGI